MVSHWSAKPHLVKPGPSGHRRSSHLPSARSLTIRFGQLAERLKAPGCSPGIPLGSPRFKSSTSHQCLGGAKGRRVRSRAALLRVRISPRTPSLMQDRLVAQLGRGNTLRPCPVSVRIRPSLPRARSPSGRGNRLKSGRVLVRIQPGAPDAPVADGEASGFQTRDWVFESPLGCHAPQQQVVSGRVATSVCAVRFRGGAPTFNVGEWTSC